MVLKVSVVVATYERGKMLFQVLRDLLQQDYSNFEIVLVDQTKTPYLVDDQKFLDGLISRRKVKYVRQETPSLPLARNTGIRNSQGEVIIFIDDDVRLEKDFVSSHAKNYGDSRVFAVAGKVNFPYPVEFPDAQKCRDQNRDWWYLTFQLEKYGEIAGVVGCNMSFRKSLLEKIGGFDVNFLRDSNKEETDVWFRMKKLGGKMVFDPNAELLHLVEQEGGTRTKRRDITLSSMFYRNQFYFFLKNLGLAGVLKYSFLLYRYFVGREKERLYVPTVFMRFLRRNGCFFLGAVRGVMVFLGKRFS